MRMRGRDEAVPASRASWGGGGGMRGRISATVKPLWASVYVVYCGSVSEGESSPWPQDSLPAMASAWRPATVWIKCEYPQCGYSVKIHRQKGPMSRTSIPFSTHTMAPHPVHSLSSIHPPSTYYPPTHLEELQPLLVVLVEVVHRQDELPLHVSLVDAGPQARIVAVRGKAVLGGGAAGERCVGRGRGGGVLDVGRYG